MSTPKVDIKVTQPEIIHHSCSANRCRAHGIQDKFYYFQPKLLYLVEASLNKRIKQLDKN